MFETLWFELPIWVQDLLVLLALLAPLFVTGLICLRGYRITPLLIGLLRRHRMISMTFIALIATSVAISASLIAQERGLRAGTARAAEKFDLVVAAPGSEITAMLAAVYLQTSALPLVDGDTYAKIANHELVSLAAPLAFGDSWNGAPVVGTTAAFVDHLSEGLNTGRMFATIDEAIAGAAVDLNVGDKIAPVHGDGSAGAADEHGFEYEIVGTMPATGSPWDKAILVPVESVWDVHNLPNGHALDWDGTLGGPFAPDYFPGTPAVLVRAEALWANYALQSEFNTDPNTMAFFPGSILAQLHALMGDIRQLMSILAVTTQVLVAIAVLSGLAMLSKLLSRRLALLRALGAPRRFILALNWGFATVLIVIGAGIGLVLGIGATAVLSAMITQRTNVLVTAHLGWPELHMVAGFVSFVAILSFIPAYAASRRPITENLRT